MTAQCSTCYFGRINPATDERTCTFYAPAPQYTVAQTWPWPVVADDFFCGQGADVDTGVSFSEIVNALPSGPIGIPGPGYKATSTTSLATVNSGSFSFTDVEAGLAYSIGARIRATSRGTGEWMEGIVTAYAEPLLTFTADLNSGAGTHADWDINLAGQSGVIGATGAAGINAPQWTMTQDIIPSGGSDGDFWMNFDNASTTITLFKKISGTWQEQHTWTANG